jgi:hypothetical protein
VDVITIELAQHLVCGEVLSLAVLKFQVLVRESLLYVQGETA